ncbi:nucleoside kinase [Clostridium sp. D2Q-11]|uniref:Nucleoside kinase n=1 Tax=Anaeromonas frigoriresistens TaxID=2683708 RepID=A0A942UWR5_9FIRM|nr:nucleoside kinase [Anaeromonas frigoriresistens]MBS4537811.1 nucleoside kinase [Anaeromonas frigoriresistens]
MKDLEVTIDGVGNFSVRKGTKIKDVIKVVNDIEHKNYLCARIDNEIKHLDFTIESSKDIELLDITDKDGIRVYARTLTFILLKAIYELFPKSKVSIEHSLSKGLYVEIHKEKDLQLEDIDKIKTKINEIIKADLPIHRILMKTSEANEIFKKQDMTDKLRLGKYREKDYVHVYELDGLFDKFYGYLAPSTGYIKYFDISYYHPGIILRYPRKESNFKIPEFKEQNKIAQIFREAEEWVEILDVADVGSLNDKILEGSIEEIIRVSEALHEKKTAYIADKISENENIKIILIAGPSSSGKTTFAQRLYTQLRVNGKRPISLSIDDYFVNREDTPLDENGNYDFESIDAVDIMKFNEDLITLLDGGKIDIPKFNFLTGKREVKIKGFSIAEDQPIIIEGIHGLNEKLTNKIPHMYKFKIYVSALTQLNIDKHNRIPTTDNRLIRRIVRDSKYRGRTAEGTLELWSSVRRGEERNIFPYQEQADVMFNSALVYELAVLRKYAEPLLKEVTRSSIHYGEAKRLLKFLGYFKIIRNDDIIPSTSILKEFIGGSCYREEE